MVINSKHIYFFVFLVSVLFIYHTYVYNDISIPAPIGILLHFNLLENALCCIVTHSFKFTHITPQLKKTPLAPSQVQSTIHIGLITYKILNHGQPAYLSELIHPYTSSRNIRRSSPKLKFLHIPPLIAQFTNQTNHFPILSVTMSQFFGTLSPST